MRRIRATGVTSLGRPAAWTPAPIPGMPQGLRSGRATTLHAATGQGEVKVEARRGTASFLYRRRRSLSACISERQGTRTLRPLIAQSRTCANLAAYADASVWRDTVSKQTVTEPTDGATASGGRSGQTEATRAADTAPLGREQFSRPSEMLPVIQAPTRTLYGRSPCFCATDPGNSRWHESCAPPLIPASR